MDKYKIEKVETKKDLIDNPEEVDDGIIPPLGSSLLLCGKSGSGKSTLLASLINDSKERFYTGMFDKLFLFSPTAEGDDVQKQYGIEENHVYTDLQDAPELIKLIHDSQRRKVKEMGADKAPQYAIIFDDVIGDTKFMNSKEFTQCFYQTRHVNCTTFICTQHFKRVPRVCRMQANFICFFRGGRNEVEMISEEFSPPFVTKNQMMAMVDNATKEPYSFFTINMKTDWENRFRQNLFPIIPLASFQGQKNETVSLKEDTNESSRGEQEMATTSRERKNETTGGRTNEGEFREERRSRFGKI